MKNYILAHDLGTSGNKATLYNLMGQLITSSTYAYPTYYPKANWVEQDPQDWWHAVCTSTKDLIKKSGIDKNDIACITFSAQMMGCLPVNRDGMPLRHSIIWADLRSIKEEGMMEEILGMENVYQITGHRISASYTAAKILWLKENEPDVYRQTYKFLQAKDYIILKLTGQFITDYSDASGTNLLDIKEKKWSQDILKGLNIEHDKLPRLVSSTSISGKITEAASKQTGLVEGTPVVTGGGDGSCAAVGAGVVDQGSTYNVIGSSSWIAYASEQPVFDDEMKTFNWVHLDPNLYSPCGTMQSAGYSYHWLKNTLCTYEIFQAEQNNEDPYDYINKSIEKSPPGSNKLLFLPYLLGERSPRWNPHAKGAFIGLNMSHTKEDIYRSVLEGVGFNLKVILDVFTKVLPINEIMVIGGGAKCRVWLQIMADIWQKTVLVPEYIEEATSMGAAICGGVGIGAFESFNVIKKFNRVKYKIEPKKSHDVIYKKLYDLYNQSYQALVPIYRQFTSL